MKYLNPPIFSGSIKHFLVYVGHLRVEEGNSKLSFMLRNILLRRIIYLGQLILR